MGRVLDGARGVAAVRGGLDRQKETGVCVFAKYIMIIEVNVSEYLTVIYSVMFGKCKNNTIVLQPGNINHSFIIIKVHNHVDRLLFV